MNNKSSLFGILFLALFLFGCGQFYNGRDIMYQTSTLNALVEAVYDGEITCGELKKHGDFGIGTFNGLDGEMIVLEGKIYQVKADGVAYPIFDSTKTPFAVVKFFKTNRNASLKKDLNYDHLQEYLDGLLPSKNLFYAVKIEGTFRYVKARSVPKQNKPYPGLVEVTKNQKVFEFRNVEGTIVGLRCPEYTKGINLPGYHFHFITKDRGAGGHLLECTLQAANVEIDSTSKLYMVLPENNEFLKADLSGEKESQVKKAER